MYYDAVYSDSSILFWVILFVIGLILKRLFGNKGDSCIEWGAFALIAIVSAVIIFGFGTAFVGVAQKYPWFAILAIAFILYVRSKEK